MNSEYQTPHPDPHTSATTPSTQYLRPNTQNL